MVEQQLDLSPAAGAADPGAITYYLRRLGLGRFCGTDRSKCGIGGRGILRICGDGPSNILLQRDDENGEAPKIIDFGLAKTAAQEGAPLTRAGQIVGTPQYMSPEQIARQEVDARSDVYALGCVVYAMLCGRPPFADTGDDMQLLYRQVHEPVEPLRKVAPEVTEELEAVVMKALAKSPAQRFQSAEELAKALIPAVEKRAARRVVVDATQVIRLPRSRSTVAWWALFAVALALFAAAGGVWLARTIHAGMLIVISDPAGAAVDIDGSPTGDRTPTALGGIGAGTHTVTLHQDGYTDLERVVRVTDGGRALVDAHLLPRSHSVELTTVPAGATVYLDGTLVAGKTPLSFDLVDGEYHAIRIEKAGYETAMQRLKPEDTGPVPRVVLVAESVPRGTVFVESNAPAEVWVDGLASGFMSPTPGLRLGPGLHRLELRDSSGGILAAKSVPVGKGETLRIVLPLPAGKGGVR